MPDQRGRRWRLSVVIIVVFDEFALPGLAALVDGECGDDEPGDGVESGGAGEGVEAKAGEGGDGQQDADFGFGGVGQYELVAAE